MTQQVKHCPRCGQVAVLSMVACGRCGRVYRTQLQPAVTTARTTDDPLPFRLALGGCAGVTMAVPLLLIGGALCFTGIGALIGIPMMFFSVISMFVGPFAGLRKTRTIRGECPHCYGALRTTSEAPGVTCPACKKRSIVRDGQFIAM